MNIMTWQRLTCTLTLALTCLGSTLCSAQAGVPHYTYDRYNGYVPFYGYGGGMTAAMGAGIGVGAAAQGLGQAKVDQGQYEMEHTQAESMQLQAYQEYLKTLDMQRAEVRSQQSDLDAQRKQMQEKDRQLYQAWKKNMAARAAPHRLTDVQFDRETGVIHWPLVLRDSMFDDSREKLDKLFHERTAENSGAGSPNCAAIEQATQEMMKIVGKDIKNLSPDEFITAKHFIGSLAYEARFTTTGAPPPVDQP